MTPDQLRAIRQRTKAWDLHAVFGDRINLLAEVDRLTAELATAKADAWDEGWERGYFDRAADEYHGKEGGTTNPYRSTR